MYALYLLLSLKKLGRLIDYIDEPIHNMSSQIYKLALLYFSLYSLSPISGSPIASLSCRVWIPNAEALNLKCSLKCSAKHGLNLIHTR